VDLSFSSPSGSLLRRFNQQLRGALFSFPCPTNKCTFFMGKVESAIKLSRPFSLPGNTQQSLCVPIFFFSQAKRLRCVFKRFGDECFFFFGPQAHVSIDKIAVPPLRAYALSCRDNGVPPPFPVTSKQYLACPHFPLLRDSEFLEKMLFVHESSATGDRLFFLPFFFPPQPGAADQEGSPPTPHFQAATARPPCFFFFPFFSR